METKSLVFSEETSVLAYLRRDDPKELMSKLKREPNSEYILVRQDYLGKELNFGFLASVIRFRAVKCLKALDSMLSNLLSLPPDYVQPLHVACIDNWEEGAVFLVQKGARLDLFDVNKKTPLAYVADHENIALLSRIVRCIDPRSVQMKNPFQCVFIGSERQSFITYCVVNRYNKIISSCGQCIQRGFITEEEMVRAAHLYRQMYPSSYIPRILSLYMDMRTKHDLAELFKLKQPVYPKSRFDVVSTPKSIPVLDILSSFHLLCSLTSYEMHQQIPHPVVHEDDLSLSLLTSNNLWTTFVDHLTLQRYFDSVFASDMFVHTTVGDDMDVLIPSELTNERTSSWINFGVVLCHCAYTCVRAKIPALHPLVYLALCFPSVEQMQHAEPSLIEEYFYISDREKINDFRGELLSQYNKETPDGDRIIDEAMYRPWRDMLKRYRGILQGINNGFYRHLETSKTSTSDFSDHAPSHFKRFLDIFMKTPVPVMRLWFEGPQTSGGLSTQSLHFTTKKMNSMYLELDEQEFMRCTKLLETWVATSDVSHSLIRCVFGAGALVPTEASTIVFRIASEWQPNRFTLLFPVRELVLGVPQSTEELDRMAHEAIEFGVLTLSSSSISHRYPEYI